MLHTCRVTGAHAASVFKYAKPAGLKQPTRKAFIEGIKQVRPQLERQFGYFLAVDGSPLRV